MRAFLWLWSHQGHLPAWPKILETKVSLLQPQPMYDDSWWMNTTTPLSLGTWWMNTTIPLSLGWENSGVYVVSRRPQEDWSSVVHSDNSLESGALSDHFYSSLFCFLLLLGSSINHLHLAVLFWDPLWNGHWKKSTWDKVKFHEQKINVIYSKPQKRWGHLFLNSNRACIG